MREDKVDFNPMIPIWVQVSTILKTQIATGSLPPGGKLPGGRDLALKYGINPNTAARIYQEMEREGLCFTKRGMGTFVTQDKSRISRLKDDMAKDALEAFLTSFRDLGLEVKDAIDMLEKLSK